MYNDKCNKLNLHMPIRKITKGKQTCYQYGTEGKTYCGTGAKKKATTQAKAIQASKSKKK